MRRALLACVLSLVFATWIPACSRSTPAKISLTPSPPPLPVATGDFPTYGHAPDFSWLAGRIEHGLACTYIIFGAGKSASWGGRLPLEDPQGLSSSLAQGDFIIAHGELDRLGYGNCGAPSYAVRFILEH